MEELGVGERRQQGRRLSAQKRMTQWTLRELTCNAMGDVVQEGMIKTLCTFVVFARYLL
jgi:hypothetical protein